MLQCIDDEFRMQIMWCCHQNGITASRIDHFPAIIKYLDRLRKIVPCPVQAALPDIRYGGQFHIRHHPFQHIACMTGSHTPNTNNAQSYLFHLDTFPFIL